MHLSFSINALCHTPHSFLATYLLRQAIQPHALIPTYRAFSILMLQFARHQHKHLTFHAPFIQSSWTLSIFREAIVNNYYHRMSLLQTHISHSSLMLADKWRHKSIALPCLHHTLILIPTCFILTPSPSHMHLPSGQPQQIHVAYSIIASVRYHNAPDRHKPSWIMLLKPAMHWIVVHIRYHCLQLSLSAQAGLVIVRLKESVVTLYALRPQIGKLP